MSTPTSRHDPDEDVVVFVVRPCNVERRMHSLSFSLSAGSHAAEQSGGQLTPLPPSFLPDQVAERRRRRDCLVFRRISIGFIAHAAGT